MHHCANCETRQEESFFASLDLVASADDGAFDGVKTEMRLEFCSTDCLIDFMEEGDTAELVARLAGKMKRAMKQT
jgi:hypothetical protein